MHIHRLFLRKAQLDVERSGHVLHFVENKKAEREENMQSACVRLWLHSCYQKALERVTIAAVCARFEPLVIYEQTVAAFVYIYKLCVF